MAKSVMIKLFIGIIIVLIICIPELIKTINESTVILSCVEAGVNERPNLSIAENASFLCQEQWDEVNIKSDVLETFISQRKTIAVTIVQICINTSHNHSEKFYCVPVYQEQGNMTNCTLEIMGKFLLFSYQKFHFVLLNSEENPSSPLTLEIFITNVTDREQKLATNCVFSSCQTKEMSSQEDIITISMQFNSNVPYYTSTPGIIWLALLPVIFLSAVFMVIYKIITKNRDG
ncbi:transmembrane protein 156 [Pelodytes ibericus]